MAATARSHGRLILAFLVGLASLMPILPAEHAMAAGDSLLFVRPHCENVQQDLCPMFSALDPLTLQTEPLAVGAILDLDLMVLNPSSTPVNRFRVWLSYDTQVLEGSSIEAAPAFPLVTPGEADFAPSQGYGKISASADAASAPHDFLLPLARIKFVVKNAPTGGQSPLSFYDLQDNLNGHTFVVGPNADQNILQAALGSLIVRINAEAPTDAVSSAAPTPDPLPTPLPTPITDTASSVADVGPTLPVPLPAEQVPAEEVVPSPLPSPEPAPTAGVAFSQIQIQNVRAGTDKTEMYIAWDQLRSAQLKGYYVYYGTRPGSYVQRRSLDKNVTTTIISPLNTGTRYYAALRPVSTNGEEGAFSQEVSVVIGDPLSSTNALAFPPAGPFNGNVTAPPNPIQQGTATTVPGAAGAPSSLLLLLLLSACIGTGFALRRQFAAVSPSA